MKHWADKFILRDLFWFLVMPYNFGLWMAERNQQLLIAQQARRTK